MNSPIPSYFCPCGKTSLCAKLLVWKYDVTCTVIRMKINSFSWFWWETFCTSTRSANGSSDGESQSLLTLFFVLEECCFSGPGWIFLFFCWFWAENILVLFLNYSLWHFRFRIYWGINCKCLVFRPVLRYIVHVLHRFFVAVIEV